MEHAANTIQPTLEISRRDLRKVDEWTFREAHRIAAEMIESAEAGGEIKPLASDTPSPNTLEFFQRYIIPDFAK